MTRVRIRTFEQPGYTSWTVQIKRRFLCWRELANGAAYSPDMALAQASDALRDHIDQKPQ